MHTAIQYANLTVDRCFAAPVQAVAPFFEEGTGFNVESRVFVLLVDCGKDLPL